MFCIRGGLVLGGRDYIYIMYIYIILCYIQYILSLFPTMPMLFSISQLFLCFCNLCSTPPHSRWPPAWASANSCAALCGDPIHPSNPRGFHHPGSIDPSLTGPGGLTNALKFALRYGSKSGVSPDLLTGNAHSLWMNCWDVHRFVYGMVVWISTWLDLYG